MPFHSAVKIWRGGGVQSFHCGTYFTVQRYFSHVYLSVLLAMLQNFFPTEINCITTHNRKKLVTAFQKNKMRLAA